MSLVDLVETWLLRRSLQQRGEELHINDAGVVVVIPNPWTLRPTLLGDVAVLWAAHAADLPWGQQIAPGDILAEVRESLAARRWNWWTSKSPRDRHVAQAVAWGRLWRLGQLVPPLLLDKQGMLLDGYHRLLAARAMGRDRVPCAAVETNQ